MPHSILLLPGDGIGPEVSAQARKILELLGPHCGGIDLHEADFGGVACDRHGDPLPEATLEQALASDATLLGAVGGPNYDSLPTEQRPEKGLLRLRAGLKVYANLRPVRIYPELIESSSLRPEFIRKLDLVIVREFIGGLYFATPRGIDGIDEQRVGYNTMSYSVPEIRRITTIALKLAANRRKVLCSVDKANVLEVSRLWRDVVTEMAAKEPDIEVSHLYVDNAAMQLVRQPEIFDVILTDNIFGDILSDLAAEMVGSIGMLPSAALGDKHGLYEPIHGSAPDIAAQDLANPCAAILSVAMMLESSLDQPQLATKVRDAVGAALAAGHRTQDLCRAGEKPLPCSEMGAAIHSELAGLLA